MSAHHSALLMCFVLLSACDRRTEQAGPPAKEIVREPSIGNNQASGTSVMRPEVTAEVAAPEPAPPAPEPLRLVISFPQGAELDAAAREALDELIARPAFAAGGAVTLSGHSDASGSDADNLATSRRRAEAVRDYLLAMGVKADRITLVALGERRPVAPNALPDGSDDPEGRQRNRRVDVLVAPGAPPVAAPSPTPPTK